jgi:hypothetical protein
VPELARIVDLADISQALAWTVALDFREVALISGARNRR